MPGVNQSGVVPASGDDNVLPAPSADEFDEEEVDLDTRDFDEEDEDFDEDDEDLETRDFDEEDEDLEEDDEEPSELERRTPKKTKAAPGPKPTKAPKPKVTKAPKPKTTKAKSTKAKSTKAKTTKKATKTTKAATTTKVTKTKASKTTKATGTAVASAVSLAYTQFTLSESQVLTFIAQCPIKKPAKKTRTFSARTYDFVARLFERDNEEFVGWHGTNSVRLVRIFRV